MSASSPQAKIAVSLGQAAPREITATKMDSCKQPYRLSPTVHGLSHGLKSVHRTLFTPVCALVPPFQVLRRISEKSDSISCRTFLAGALGLEPRAYGFGDVDPLC